MSRPQETPEQKIKPLERALEDERLRVRPRVNPAPASTWAPVSVGTSPTHALQTTAKSPSHPGVTDGPRFQIP